MPHRGRVRLSQAETSYSGDHEEGLQAQWMAGSPDRHAALLFSVYVRTDLVAWQNELGPVCDTRCYESELVLVIARLATMLTYTVFW